MDMLPAGKSGSPILPLSRRPSWNDRLHHMSDLSAVVEGETRNPQAPELDAEAPGPYILEIETVDAVLETYS